MKSQAESPLPSGSNLPAEEQEDWGDELIARWLRKHGIEVTQESIDEINHLFDDE